MVTASHTPRVATGYRQHRRGSTMIEQLWVLLLVGILVGLAVGGGAKILDATVVRASANDVASAFASARDQAIATGTRTAVELNSRAGRVVVHADADTTLRLELQRMRSVSLESTRDSMAYAPSGLGFGAANLRVIVQRGTSADTITVSRLGRVKR